jgi:hypothetical protein
MLAFSGGVALAASGLLAYSFRPREGRPQRPDSINTTAAILITAGMLIGVSLLVASVIS